MKGKAVRRLILVTGQEGAGKSSTIRALLPWTPHGAQVDAEDVGQVNPWTMDAAFRELLWSNVTVLAENFWAAGYSNVISGSFFESRRELEEFSKRVPGAEVIVIQLLADKTIRDARREVRKKRSTAAWRDQVDIASPMDDTLESGQPWYRFLRVDNGEQSLDETVSVIVSAFPDVFVQA